MKNTKRLTAFVLALALVVIFVPTFVIGATDTLEETNAIPADTTVENENYIVDDNATHNCTITEANATRHIVDCECGMYDYVQHYTLEASVTNAFFHSYECVCGYSYSENHNFATTYTATSHQEVCVDCGYKKEAESHLWENDFYSQYHDVQCAGCGFIAEHHVGVSSEAIDEYNCLASCRQCGIVEVVAHEFYDFDCNNCGYEVSGYSYGIVEDIREVDDGYRVRFMVNGNSHRITIENAPNFNEGDFVKIAHDGNVIFEVEVIVDGDIVDDAENFINYLCQEEAEDIREFEELCWDSPATLEDFTLEDFHFHSHGDESWLWVNMKSGRNNSCHSRDIVVYDLRYGEMGALTRGDAYILISTEQYDLFVCFW